MGDCEKAVYGTDTWRERGCTSKMIFEYAKRTGRGACMVHGGKSLEVIPGPDPLVFALQDNHAYFYQDSRVRKQLMNRKKSDFQKIERGQRYDNTGCSTLEVL